MVRYYNNYENLALWKELTERECLKDEIPIAKNIIDKAAQKLDRIIEVFPTFTLHNTKHSENVLINMEKLLGTKISDLSDSELLMLILSAYLHDVGMYYSDDEIDSIKTSDDFIRYLDEYPSEYLKYNNSVESSKEVINSFCRCYHAKRVFGFVEDIEIDLKIRSLDILNKTAKICESHTENVHSIINNKELNIQLGYESDMKFCAILLRLADYIDFDNSRSPEYMFYFLDIKNKDKICIENWERHINSGGFYFGVEDGNVLGYCAEPEEPYIEYTIRCLLDEIEKELKECRDIILNVCNNRWKNFKLPYEIDRRQIKGKGYSYGEYTFTLKKEKVLDLFMGGELYNEKFVFIREIIQNAIDTSCYRQFWEESKGIDNSVVLPIEIYDWKDESGNHFIRINDYGMGMSKKIIEKYFLKVGESFYSSDDFVAEKFKIKRSQNSINDFQPISQFGIGFLSCFLVCDSIEIQTVLRPMDNSRSDVIRLSINGVEGFYTMRLNGEANNLLNKPGYSERKEYYGTSIVFHLSPKLYDGDFELEKYVKKYVFCPPISVVVNNQILDYMDDSFIHKKIIEVDEQIEITEQENSDCINGLKKWLNRNQPPKIYLKKYSCDFSELSSTSNLMGQGIFFYITTDEPIQLQEGIWIRNYTFVMQYNQIDVTLSKTIDKMKLDTIKKDIGILLSVLRKNLKLISKNNYLIHEKYLNKVQKYRNTLENIWKNSENLTLGISLKTVGAFFTDMYDKIQKKFKKRSGKPSNKECQKYLSESISFVEKINNEFLKCEEQSRHNANITFQIDLKEDSVLEVIRDIQKKNNYYLSYNGIIIPKKANRNNSYFKYQNNKFFSFGIMPYIIALRNSLRPQLNLARNEVNNMEWAVYSNINLAAKKFFHALNICITSEPFARLSAHMTYREVLHDSYIKNEWKEYRIIQTTTSMMSFYDILQNLRQGKDIQLIKINRVRTKEKADFFSICSYTLLQLGFDIWMKVINNRDGFTGRCGVSLLLNQEDRLNESYYAPLFFAEFEEEEHKGILCFSNSPLNRKHPFSKWLLSITPKLYDSYREIFNAIIMCFDDFDFKNGIQTAQKLNDIMQNIAEINPNLRIDGEITINYKTRMLY